MSFMMQVTINDPMSKMVKNIKKKTKNIIRIIKRMGKKIKPRLEVQGYVLELDYQTGRSTS